MIARTCAASASVRLNFSSGLVVSMTTSPPPYHAKRCSKPDSSGPEMKPSRETLAPVVIFVMPV